MSLRVWLPLTGTLENKGISNISIISGTPSYKTGKIGANALNLNNRITFDCASLANLQTFSICFWGMSETSSTLTANWMDLMGFTDVSSSGSNGTFRWETGYNGNNGIHWHDNGTNAMVSGSHGHITSHGIWKHCCVVFNYEKGKIYSYDDGILTQTHNHAGGHFNSNGRFYLGETNNIEGRITDVRIYDHALSSAEVKEISQGLVLHYKLDDITNGIVDSSGYGHNGTINDTALKLVSDTARYSAAIQNSQANNSATFPFKGQVDIPDSLVLTFSWWMKPTTWGIQTSGIFSTSAEDSPTDYYTTAANMRDSCFDCCNTNGTCVRINVASYLTLNEWHHYALTYNGSQLNFYKDGVSKVTASQSGSLKAFKNIFPFYSKAGGANRCTSGSLSDFRIYVTALSAADVKQLYEVSAKVDNLQNLHIFEIKETNHNLLAGRLWSNWYSQHNLSAGLFTNFNSKGEYQFTANGTSAGTEYIPINPTGHTYEYDYTISVNTGNQFYIGFERYDANKTARSNNACVYTYATKPSSDVVKQHFTGVVNLSTDGTNPCAFIALRILNGWSGTTNGVTGTATIHNISLREIGVKQQPKLTKQGQFIEEELKEETNMKLHKNGIVEANNLIEF